MNRLLEQHWLSLLGLAAGGVTIAWSLTNLDTTEVKAIGVLIGIVIFGYTAVMAEF